MKKYLFLLIIAVFLLPGNVLAETGNFIVTVEQGAELSEEIISAYDLEALTEEEHGLYVTTAKNAEDLLARSEIVSVSETKYATLSFSANDPFYTAGRQWAFEALNIPYARDLLSSQAHTIPTIVVIDTGYTFQHPDAGNVIGGKDYIDESDVTYDHFTHGTECAGLIGATSNNGIGITGIFDACTIIVLSIFQTDSNKEAIADTADIAAALYDAVDVYHADVISMSFGGDYTEEVENAVKYAYDNNIILVAAVGNNGTKNSPLEYPAALSQVIGVANMSTNYKIHASSSKNDSVFISAPGTSIVTLTNPDFMEPAGTLYGEANGTSLATPYIAALAAMARAYDPGLTPTEFMNDLKKTGKDLETSGYDIRSGYGLADYNALLTAVLSDNGAYVINNEATLKSFITAVNHGDSDLSAFLSADITVTGNLPAINSDYNGTFDGNGHRLSGLTAPLFTTIGVNGVVKGLTVNGDLTSAGSGGIIANVNRGAIYQCISEGLISGDNVGGVVGLNRGGSITSCINRAVVNGETAGGIAGSMSNQGKIAHCGNIAAITSSDRKAGGICGLCTSAETINGCYNSGTVTGTTATGGIVAEDSANAVSNCFYAESSVANGVSNNENYIPKAADYMKTAPFLLMLNRERQSFCLDTSGENNGYPLPAPGAKLIWFNDVAANSWYADAVYNLAEESIVLGRDIHRYTPDATITRAEFITILARLNGVNLDEYEGNSSFSDVPAKRWYTAAINWATANDMAYGKSETLFSPNDKVTREEICCFIMRYLRAYATSPLNGMESKDFTDSSTISSWAASDVADLTSLAIINGFPDQTFRPKESATRAQAAVMINAANALCQ